MCVMINTFKNPKAVANLLSQQIFHATNVMDDLSEVKEVREYLEKIGELYEFKEALRLLTAIHHKIDHELGI